MKNKFYNYYPMFIRSFWNRGNGSIFFKSNLYPNLYTFGGIRGFMNSKHYLSNFNNNINNNINNNDNDNDNDYNSINIRNENMNMNKNMSIIDIKKDKFNELILSKEFINSSWKDKINKIEILGYKVENKNIEKYNKYKI
jgi:hypothetical protein